MARYKVCLTNRSQGKNVEFMLKGDTIEDALAGTVVKVFLMQRTVVNDHPGERRPWHFDKRVLMKMIRVGEPIEELPF